jgi:hypothetical protein
MAVEGALGALVDAIEGASQDSIVYSVISTLGSELSLFLFLAVVDDRSAVARAMIYMPLISFPARV